MEAVPATEAQPHPHVHANAVEGGGAAASAMEIERRLPAHAFEQRNYGVMNLVFAGLAPATAVFLTNPLDMARVRTQLNAEGTLARGQYRNVVDCLVKVGQREGIAGLYAGIGTACWREVIQNVPRLGLYGPLVGWIRRAMGVDPAKKDPFEVRLVASATCGATGGLVSNPAEIIKTRVQSGRYCYTGPLNGLSTMVHAEGFTSLLNGARASMLRCTVGTTSNLLAVTYSQDHLRETPWYQRQSPSGSRDFVVDMLSGLFGGTVLSVCMNPFDTVRTRLYSQPKGPTGQGLLYNGLVDALSKTVLREGPSALFKGLPGNIFRQGPHTCLVFVFKGFLERQYGLFARSREVERVWDELSEVKRRTRQTLPTVQDACACTMAAASSSQGGSAGAVMHGVMDDIRSIAGRFNQIQDLERFVAPLDHVSLGNVVLLAAKNGGVSVGMPECNCEGAHRAVVVMGSGDGGTGELR